MTSLRDDYTEALQFITALADSLDAQTSFGGNHRDDSLIDRARGFARVHRLDTPAPTQATPDDAYAEWFHRTDQGRHGSAAWPEVFAAGWHAREPTG